MPFNRPPEGRNESYGGGESYGRWPWWHPLLLLFAVGCAGAGLDPIPRRLHGTLRFSAFVPPHAYEAFLRGERARALGRLEEARVAYRQARSAPEEDPLVLARLGETNALLGRSEEAASIFALGQELFPDSEALWLARGRVLTREGDLSTAEAAFWRAHCVAPESPTSVLALTQLLSRRDPERAAALLRVFDNETGGSSASHREALKLALARGDARETVRWAVALATEPSGDSESAEAVLRELQVLGLFDLASEVLASTNPERVRPELAIEVWMAAGNTAQAEAALLLRPPADIDLTVRLWLELGALAQARDVAERAWLARPGPDEALALARIALASRDQAEQVDGIARLGPLLQGTSRAEDAQTLLSATLRGAHFSALAALLPIRSAEVTPSGETTSSAGPP